MRYRINTIRKNSARSVRFQELDGWSATPASHPAFLDRISINYLCHHLSEYDTELANVFGTVGVRDGYQEINRRAYTAIATAYPTLAAECQRQYEAKFWEEGFQGGLAK